MLTTHSTKIQSVSELSKSIRGMLETGFSFVTVVGEISNLKRPYSGHIYFILKDNEAQLRAVLFKQQMRYLSVVPEDGLEVLCKGRISLYEPRGEYQLVIDTIDSRGAGQLQISFDKLKLSLANEGLFDQSAKIPIPVFPEKISLITSPEGAAVHDFLKSAEKRYPGFPIEIIPVRVQGRYAADEIIEALEFLNKQKKTAVIVLCRGGGSIEDLFVFNDEAVARAIYASKIPVVSAIGHEVDFTISDFVADLRAATPTAAAEAVIPEKHALVEKIKRAEYDLLGNISRILERYQYRIDSQKRLLVAPTTMLANISLKLTSITASLSHLLRTKITVNSKKLALLEFSLFEANPDRILKLKKQRVDELYKLSQLLIRLKIDKGRDQLGKSAALLDAVSPLAILGRGYSITLAGINRQVIRNSHELSVGENVEVILDSGSFEAELTSIKY